MSTLIVVPRSNSADAALGVAVALTTLTNPPVGELFTIFTRAVIGFGV
jgi:hypothetical protein